MIEAINSLDLGWKADTCKYQKHHANYGSHCESQILAQVSSKSNENEGEENKEVDLNGKKIWGGEGFNEALAEARKYQTKYNSADQIPDNEVPANFDWRDI